MQISQIKQSLTLEQVLKNYNLQPNQNKMLNCPFHEDKTASLQVNLQKNLYKCHACGKKGDQIQFVEDFEKITKHEALKKCTEMAGNDCFTNVRNDVIKEPSTNNQNRTTFLEKIFSSFRKGIFNSIPAKDYCKSRSLNYEKLEIGYNGGQFHHGTRKDEELIKNCLEIGLLLDKGQTAKTGDKAYSVFGKWCLVFPLKNKENQIVSLYFRSVIAPSPLERAGGEASKHFYLKNRQGLYPNYPNPDTKKLILTESIIDAASLLQTKNIIENHSLIACFGTNGLNEEILKAIKELKQLEEIIFAFDNDNAGKEAVTKYANQLKMNNEKLKITSLDLPNKDINETLQLHNQEIFLELLEKREDVIAKNEAISSFSTEKINEIKTTEETLITEEAPPSGVGGLPIDFLKQPNLLQNINNLLGKIGIVGEENNRLLQFVTASTYKMNYNLHILYQGSSGSGKTHTIKQIALLMPPEDVIYLTRVTDSSLYNYKGGEFMFKLIVFEDMDGLKEDALLAVREMISNKKLSSSTSVKDKRGNADGKIKEVEVSFASLSATTKGELYEDNMSRIIVLSVDESKEQTKRIIAYKNQLYQGKIDRKEQEKTRYFLRDCVRLLQVLEVVNPFAHLVELPENVHKPTRMHDLVMGVINQIVILNQYQRKRTKNNEIIAEKEDIIQGLELMKDSILLKMDELEGKIRTFYEALKKYVEQKAKKTQKNREEIKFTRFDIKDHFMLSKAQINRYLTELVFCEYLEKTGKYGKSTQYKISHWDNFKTLSQSQLDTMLSLIK